MNPLRAQSCVACRADAPRVTAMEKPSLLAEIPEWSIIEIEGIERLTRTYRLPDFAAALELTNAIGRIAEEQDHHPAITTEWGRVTVQWWTHKIRGLHRNDFIMAARSDACAEGR